MVTSPRAGGTQTVWCELPTGARGRDGVRRRYVRMRPATALDELRAFSDFRVCLRSDSFLTILLARVVVELAAEPTAGTGVSIDLTALETLDAEDLSALERQYRELNHYEVTAGAAS